MMRIKLSFYRAHHRYLQCVHLQWKPAALDLSNSVLSRDPPSECDDIPQSLFNDVFYGSELIAVSRHKILVRVSVSGVTVNHRLCDVVLDRYRARGSNRIGKSSVRHCPVSGYLP